MKIWLFNPYGPLPGEGWRDYRFTMIMRALAARGHEVTWWTAAFDHHTKRTRGTSGDPAIRLVPTPSYRKNVGLGRLWFELMFARRIVAMTKKLDAPDVIIAADPPQANGVAATLIARRFRVPVVLDCLDLWPEAFRPALPRPLRILAAPFLALLDRARSWTYSRAAAAVASCETYRERLLSRVARLRPERISAIYLGIASSDVAPRQQTHANDRFTAVYAGSLGNNYDIATVLDAASILENIRFVIAGSGPLREYVEARIRVDGLTNTTYAGRLTDDELRDLYAGASVGLIPYAPWSTVAMPVKLFDYLAAGLPFISSLMGELSDLAERCDAGIPYRSGDAASLAAAIETLAGDPARRERMAANARECAKQFERDEQYREFSEIVERVASRDPRHGAR